MPVKYFYRELVNNSVVHDRNGKPIPWEPLANWDGVCQVDDAKNPELIEDLNKMIGTAGITSISEGEYSSKKESHPFRGYPQKSENLRVFNQPTLGRKSPGADAVVADPVPNAPLPGPAAAQPEQPPAEPVAPLTAKPLVGRPKPIAPAAP